MRYDHITVCEYPLERTLDILSQISGIEFREYGSRASMHRLGALRKGARWISVLPWFPSFLSFSDARPIFWWSWSRDVIHRRIPTLHHNHQVKLSWLDMRNWPWYYKLYGSTISYVTSLRLHTPLLSPITRTQKHILEHPAFPFPDNNKNPGHSRYNDSKIEAATTDISYHQRSKERDDYRSLVTDDKATLHLFRHGESTVTITHLYREIQVCPQDTALDL